MEDELFFKTLCEEYKKAVVNCNNAEIIKQDMRTKLIKYNDGKFDRFGIEIKTVELAPIIDWESVRKYFNISDQALSRFMVKRELSETLGNDENEPKIVLDYEYLQRILFYMKSSRDLLDRTYTRLDQIEEILNNKKYNNNE